jgi:hypothetical protein
LTYSVRLVRCRADGHHVSQVEWLGKYREPAQGLENIAAGVRKNKESICVFGFDAEHGELVWKSDEIICKGRGLIVDVDPEDGRGLRSRLVAPTDKGVKVSSTP